MMVFAGSQTKGSAQLYNLVSEDEFTLGLRPFLSQLPPAGYLPIAFEANNSTTQPIRTILRFEMAWRQSASMRSQPVTMEWVSGKSSETQLIPVLPQVESHDWARLEVSVAWARGDRNVALTRHRAASGSDVPRMIAVSRGVHPDLQSRAENLSAASSSSAPSKMFSDAIVAVADFGVPLMGWEALAGVDQLWMPEDEWRALSLVQRGAIRDWLLRGGRLHLLESDPARKRNLEVVEHAGWGQIVRWGKRDLDDTETLIWEQGRLLPMSLSASLAGGYRTNFELADRVGEIALNIPLLYTLAAALMVVAGPMNLFLFAGKHRRARMFFTTPLISLVAGLVFLVAIVISDGVGGRGERWTLILSMPDENRLVTVTEQVSRSGLLGKTDFRREPGTVAFPIIRAAGDTISNARLSEWQDGRMGGWFQSRRVNAMRLERVEPSRYRLEVTKNGDALEVVSTFPIDLMDIYVSDKEGNVWHLERLDAGGRGALQPSSAKEWKTAWGKLKVSTGEWTTAQLSTVGELKPERFFARGGEQSGQLAIPTVPFVWSDELIVAGQLPGGETILAER